MSVWSALTISSVIKVIKKAGQRPLSGTATGKRPARLLCSQRSTAGAEFVRPRVMAQRARRPLNPRRLGGAGSGAIQIHAVVAALRFEARRQNQGLAGFGVAAEHLQAAAQTEQGEIVGRGAIDDGLELGCRLLVLLAMKQGATEGFAD